MRRLVLIISLVVVLLFPGLATGCGVILKGSGNVETEEYYFTDFSFIEIDSAFEFEIVHSPEYGIKVTADDNVIDKVRVVQDGDTLKLDLETLPRIGSINLITVITMPRLRGLDTSGAAHGTVCGFNSADDVTFEMSGASKVSGNITVGNADFTVNGASILRLRGAAENMVADISGASHFDMIDFKVGSAEITFSGASTGTVNVEDHLDADLSGASKLTYGGEPEIGILNISGASTLNRE